MTTYIVYRKEKAGESWRPEDMVQDQEHAERIAAHAIAEIRGWKGDYAGAETKIVTFPGEAEANAALEAQLVDSFQRIAKPTLRAFLCALVSKFAGFAG